MSEVATTVHATDPITALLTRAATDPNFDASKFQVAVEFLERREERQAQRAFNEAMARAQANLRAVPRKGDNTFLKSRYAKLDDMLAEILPVASEQGLSVRFGSASASQPGWQCVTCVVSLGDHTETICLEGPVVAVGASKDGRSQMTGIQATGSTTTYLKKYLLGMAFALVLSDEQDDDGEGQRQERPAAPRFTTPPSRPPATQPHPMMPNGPVDPNPVDASRPKSTLRIPRTGAEWTTWVDRLQVTLATLKGRAEYHSITGAPAFQATIEAAPPLVRRDIDAILADTYEHLPAASIENDPTIGGDELSEVEIVGADKIAAG